MTWKLAFPNRALDRRCLTYQPNPVPFAAFEARGKHMLGLWVIGLVGAAALVAVGALAWVLLHDRFGPKQTELVPSRTAQLLGQRGRVTEPIDAVAGRGRVVVGGDDWAARAEQPLAEGAEVIVDGADGIVLHVSNWKPPTGS